MHEQRSDLERFKKDAAYYEAHRQEFLRRYPDQWVAILDQRVVGVAPDAEQLLTELKARGLSVARALVEHLTNKDELLILPG